MKEVVINQCDFCNKVSFHKSFIRKHEKNCFFNPATRSCATCLWFSPLIFKAGYPTKCYLGKLKKTPEDSKMKLNTQCKKWMNHEIYFDNETYENQEEMEEKLLSGKVGYFKALQTLHENDSLRKSFSKDALNAPDPVIKLFKDFESEPKF